MKKKLLTLMTCIAMTLFIACNMKFCKSGTSDSEETKKEQPNSFTWYAGCDYEGFFDPTKITKQQIQNVYSLISNKFRFFDNTPHVHSLEQLKKLDKNTLKKLENEYLEKRKKLLEMELPNNKLWETLRQGTLHEMEQSYKVDKINYEVFINGNMAALKEFYKNDECLTLYSDALIQGGDSLLSAWDHLTEKQAAKNGYPENIWARYHEQRDSEDKYQHAMVEVMTFGWYNCAVKYIDWLEEDAKVYEEFKKFFISIKESDCVDP